VGRELDNYNHDMCSSFIYYRTKFVDFFTKVPFCFLPSTLFQTSSRSTLLYVSKMYKLENRKLYKHMGKGGTLHNGCLDPGANKKFHASHYMKGLHEVVRHIICAQRGVGYERSGHNGIMVMAASSHQLCGNL
jgi:hypothetical protein